jgi:hypothetical protein
MNANNTSSVRRAVEFVKTTVIGGVVFLVRCGR